MKLLGGLLLALALIIGSTEASFLNCKIRYDRKDYKSWYDVGYGAILGFYADPPEDPTQCPDCHRVGTNLAKLNGAIVDVERQRNLWIRKSKITNLSFFNMLSTLVKIYPLFVDFFEVVTFLLTDPIVEGLLTSLGGINAVFGEEEGIAKVY